MKSEVNSARTVPVKLVRSDVRQRIIKVKRYVAMRVNFVEFKVTLTRIVHEHRWGEWIVIMVV
jgi:hypothetical protein